MPSLQPKTTQTIRKIRSSGTLASSLISTVPTETQDLDEIETAWFKTIEVKDGASQETAINLCELDPRDIGRL